MNLGDLIEAYRDEAHDHATPPFCSDEQLTRYANEAQVEAARRAFLLADSTSPLCSVSYAADDATISLDSRIIEIRGARIGTEPLALVSGDEMACFLPAWRTDALRGQPSRLIYGVDTGKLHLYPRPATSGTVSLAVYRLPLAALVNETDKPELRAEWHQGLVYWMLYRAYSRRDADRFDPTLAADSLARFEEEFGKKHGARNEEWSRTGSVSVPPPIA